MRGIAVAQEEIIRPSQWLQARGGASRSPAMALQAGVLQLAIDDLGWDADTTIYARARAWVAAPASDWPFSFGMICHNLGLDAEQARQALLEPRAGRRCRRMASRVPSQIRVATGSRNVGAEF